MNPFVHKDVKMEVSVRVLTPVHVLRVGSILIAPHLFVNRHAVMVETVHSLTYVPVLQIGLVMTVAPLFVSKNAITEVGA